MRNCTKTNVGDFDVKSSRVVVSDPCYELGIGQSIVKNVKKGKWEGLIYVFDEGSWGQRVGYLVAHAKTYPAYLFDPEMKDWVEENDDIGVDSGQCGIFDYPNFRNDKVVEGVKRISKNEPICIDEPWYSICCDRTLSETKAGIIPSGVVSSTGFGDGCYTCKIMKKDDKVVGILIDFGVDREEEEDEEDEEDEEEDFQDVND